MTITPKDIPAQSQNRQPALESEMTPKPQYDRTTYKGSDKLKGKVALITGGDSGIGRAVAIAYAMEGAEVAILYQANDTDAEDTKKMVKNGPKVVHFLTLKTPFFDTFGRYSDKYGDQTHETIHGRERLRRHFLQAQGFGCEHCNEPAHLFAHHDQRQN